MPKKKNEDFKSSHSENEEDFFSEGEDFLEPSEIPEDTGFAPSPDPRPSNSYTSSNPEGGIDKKVVNLTGDIPVQIAAVLGKKSVTVKEIVSFRTGQVIEFNRLPNEAIDLVANGKLIAKGELVEIDGRLGIRILKMFE